MLTGVRNFKTLLVILLCIFISPAFSCGVKEAYQGTYNVEEKQSSKDSGTQIELNERGKGIWRVFDDEIPFRWDVKKSEIRLSTRQGGTIRGKIRGEILEITLPGSKILSFKKTI